MRGRCGGDPRTHDFCEADSGYNMQPWSQPARGEEPKSAVAWILAASRGWTCLDCFPWNVEG